MPARAGRLLLLGVALLLGSAAQAEAPAAERTKKILIVGDSWAMSLTKENVDGFPTPDVFDDALVANGLGAYETQGARTAWGGRRAEGWAKREMRFRITDELTAYPSIDFVHLIIGGNDFLAQVEQEDFKNLSAEGRGQRWTAITRDIETIVATCLLVRPNLHVVLAGYDYLDFERAAHVWKKSFHGVAPAKLNEWLVEFSRCVLEFAQDEPRCTYIQNFGVLQYWFGAPAQMVPLPGQAPGYDPFPGGDPARPMPSSITPDGIHPDATAHARLLQNAIDVCYAPRLRAATPAKP
jgi:lysophospholipase L1-like esterase